GGASRLENGLASQVSEIPGPLEISLPSPISIAQEPAAQSSGPLVTDGQPGSQPAEVPPLKSAVIRDDGDVASYSEEGGNGKGNFSPRRRGPGARRKRYTAARHNKRAERQSIDDIL